MNLMKKCFVFISMLLFSQACAQSKGKLSDEFQNQVLNERLRLKNAAFCTCLYKSFPKEDSIFANEGSSAAYLELGAHNLDAYLRVMEEADTYARKNNYRSKTHKNLAIMKCLDFYNSDELEELVISLDSELDKGKLKR